MPPDIDEITITETETETDLETPWNVIVYDDPEQTMRHGQFNAERVTIISGSDHSSMLACYDHRSPTRSQTH